MSNSRMQYFLTSKSLLNPIKSHLGIEMHVWVLLVALLPFCNFFTSVYFPGSPVWQHTFVSPSAFFKKGTCQLLAKVCARSTA